MLEYQIMEHDSPLNMKLSATERSVGYLVSGFSLAFLEQIGNVLDSVQESKAEKRSFLQKNLASLRKEKDKWKSFMEEDELNKEKVLQVEAAWEKRFQGDQPNVVPSLEQLAETSKEPAANSRPLRRSHTDPTDLLWVFRRRASLLSEQNNQNRQMPRRKNGFSGPCYSVTDSCYCKSIPEANDELHDKTTVQHGSNCDSHSSQDSQRKEPTSDEKARESSSDSDTKDNSPYEWTSMPVKHDEPRRKISCPAYRAGRRESLVAVHANQRRASVAAPRRMNRRGSEAPALTVIARRRNSQTLAYPVGLRRKSLRASGADHHLSIQVKAKHEMLANLVLPTLVEEFPRTRLERRNTFTFQGTTMRTKKDEKRYQVAKEILDTEKKYLACLRTLKEVFEKPIRENNLISPKEIDVLFPGELDQILKSHTLFMNDLEERLQNWKLQGIVGDIFTKLSGSYHIDVLRIYSNYVNNFPKAIGVINKASRGSHKFRKYLQHCSSNSECEGLDLPAFLLTPIQRLPRYVLLLRQLSKYTDPGHPDSFHIENALETMKQMINILNDSIQSSCKLASNSHMRRSFRRKPPKKKGKELQRSRYNSQESDRVSVGHGSISALSVESFGPGSTCSQDTSPEREAANLEERGSPTMLLESEEGRKGLDRRSRPASSGEMETSFERDTQEEFETIKEEDSGNLEDNKSPGQNVFRMAADTLKRNWQRRSKKWRRSTEEPIKRENVDDMETTVKNNDVNQEHMDEPIIALNQEIFEDENANVDLDVKSYTPPCSPATRNMKKSDGSFSPKPRPVSLGFPTGFQLRSEQQNVLKDKVLSDPSLTKEKSIENCSDVWIPRQNLPLTRRRISRQSVCSRNSSVFSGDTSPLSGSKKSLSQISQESLADSGVSETPGHSPSNTLTSRTRKWPTPERGEKLSQSLTNVSASGDSKRKLSQLNRRSWGDWISAEMENNNDEETVDRDEDRVDDAGVKNKRKFKDVMKQLFFKKKHTSTIASPSYLVEKTTNAPCPSKNSPKNVKTEIGEKISTV